MVQQIEITLKPKRRGFHLVTMLKSKAIMVVATIVAAESNGNILSYDMSQALKKNTSASDYAVWENAFKKTVAYKVYSRKWQAPGW